MIVLKIVGFGILASLMVVILKENSKEVSIVLVIASSIVLLLASINYLTPIVSMVENIVSKTSSTCSLADRRASLKVVGAKARNHSL